MADVLVPQEIRDMLLSFQNVISVNEQKFKRVNRAGVSMNIRIPSMFPSGLVDVMDDGNMFEN